MARIITQYFNQNKFSSFERGLNGYGFRNRQTKLDKYTAMHVTFFNERFKRGRYEFLRNIQRGVPG